MSGMWRPQYVRIQPFSSFVSSTATATTDNQSISFLFDHITVINDSTNEIKFNINRSSTTDNSIIVKPNEAYDEYLHGETFQYILNSTVSVTSPFRYILKR